MQSLADEVTQQKIVVSLPLVAQQLRSRGSDPDRGGAERPEPDNRIGTSIDDYRIVSRLGDGGMSTVYLAEHPRRPAPVAMKIMHHSLASDPDIAARFLVEANVLARFRHPAVLRVLETGRTGDGAPYLVMDLLSGMTLGERLEIGPIAVEDILDIASQLAGVLAVIHGAGVVHCDLKPDNIFLVNDPLGISRYLVRVIDFGVAEVRGAVSGGPDVGNGKRVLGTPQYMSPEQCRGASAIDDRSDTYAMGCLLYEMLCNRVPFDGSVPEVLVAQQHAPRPQPSAIRADTPLALEQLILAMLSVDPADRPRTMREVGLALLDAITPLAA